MVNIIKLTRNLCLVVAFAACITLIILSSQPIVEMTRYDYPIEHDIKIDVVNDEMIVSAIFRIKCCPTISVDIVKRTWPYNDENVIAARKYMIQYTSWAVFRTPSMECRDFYLTPTVLIDATLERFMIAWVVLVCSIVVAGFYECLSWLK